MQNVFAMNETDNRKIRFLYRQSGIENRYSVISDYSRPIQEWKFYPHTENLEPFPSLEQRMNWFNRYAPAISVDAIRNCLNGRINEQQITHLITISCTGMSAPGLDLQIMELMDLPKTIYRTSINFMGCYAAIHGLKMADSICKSEENARVMIVCTELCTLHFQREPTQDNIASSLLFGDGAAAVLVVPDSLKKKGIRLHSFYSEVVSKGKKDMAWELSSSGFQMTLSGYIPDLMEEDFQPLVGRALKKVDMQAEDIKNWCIHPGGRRILDAIMKGLRLEEGRLDDSYNILRKYGNMSSPTILFILKDILEKLKRPSQADQPIFGAAFGPGLTMETFIGLYQ